MICLHATLLWKTSSNRAICSACSPTVGGDSFGYAAMSRSDSHAGSKHQVELRPHPEKGQLPAYNSPSPFSWFQGAAQRHDDSHHLSTPALESSMGTVAHRPR